MKNNYVKASSELGWLQAAQELISKAMQQQPGTKKIIIKEARLISPDRFRLTGWVS
jgi:hypothetical protein